MEPELSDWEECEPVPEALSMNDASKRRCTGPEDVDTNHLKTGQQPTAPRVMPSTKNQGPAGSSMTEQHAGVTMPADVSDIDDWGSTIFKEGKPATSPQILR